MRKLSAAILASTALALQPAYVAYGQTAADTGKANPLPNSGYSVCYLSSAPGFCLFKPGVGLVSVPIAPLEAPWAIQRTGDNFGAGTLGFPTIPPLDLTYANTAASMANAVKIGDGNQISICPQLSCLSPSNGGAPYADHQRTSALISATTQIDSQAEEQTLEVETTIQTGARSVWAQGKAYAVGANVLANGQVYRATVAGTSATSGAGPSGYGASGTSLQTDGSVTWYWINAGAIATKLGPYIETAMNGGAGFSEGMVTNFSMQSAQYATNGRAADPMQGAVGIEHDFSNYSGADCIAGLANCLGMSVAFSGSNQSLTGIQLDGGGYSGFSTTATAASTTTSISVAAAGPIAAGNCVYGTGVTTIPSTTVSSISGTTVTTNQAVNVANGAALNFTRCGSTFWGLKLTNNLASAFDIDDMSNATVGLGFGVDGFGSSYHSRSAIQDGSTSPISLLIGGTKSTASISDGASTPFSYIAGGTYANAGFIVNPQSAPYGYQAYGAIANAGFYDASNSGIAFQSSGKHSSSAFNDTSTTPAAINLNGTYSVAQINAKSFTVDPSGNTSTLSLKTTGGTASTSTTTGDAVLAGGLGVGGAVNIGGAIKANSTSNFGGQITVGGGTGSGANAGVPAIVFPNYNTSGAGPNLIGSGSGVAQTGLGIGSNSDTDIYSPSLFRFYANGTLVGSIDGSGNTAIGGKLQEPLSTPASSTTTCTAGQLWADAIYVYVCTAANTQKRVALTTF